MAHVIISNHSILGKVGQGGMGDVFLAEDVQLRRKVAFKVLSARFFGDDEQRARFLREAQNAASLNHPNICTVFQVGEVESDIQPLEGEQTIRAGTPFLAMELVEGKTLLEVIRETGPLPVERLLDLSTQITEGLAEAHRCGIVHRDLKPGNIMLTASGRIKILDFGLAKALANAGHDESATDDPQATQELAGQTTNLTGELSIIGTPAYMSPEQAMGQKVDLRSDVFSLGLILSEMATGAQSYTGPTTMSVLAKVIESDPPAMKRPDLPPHFVTTVERCLRKEREERFAHGGEILDSLAAVRASGAFDTGMTTLTSAEPRASRPERRRQRRAIWAIAGGAAVVIVALLTLLQLRREPGGVDDAVPTGATTLAVVPFAHLGEPGKEYVARGIAEEITSRLAMLRELNVISSASTERHQGEPPEEVAAALQVDYVLGGSVQWAGPALRVQCTLSEANGVLKWSESIRGSPDSLFSLQARIAAAVALELDQFLEPLRGTPDANSEAYDNYLKGLQAAGQRLDAASIRRAIGFFARATTVDSTFALAWARLSTTLSWQYFAGFDRDDERMALALRSARIALALDPQLPEAHLALGYYHYRSGLEYDAALHELQAARAGMPGNSDLLLAIGAVLRRQGDVAESLDFFEQAARLDPASAYKAWESGETFRLLRRFSEAENRYQSALHLDPEATYAGAARAELHLLGLGDALRARRSLPATANEETAWVRVASYLFEEKFEEALRALSPGDFGHPAPYYLFKLWIHDVAGDTDAMRTAADSLRTCLERDRDELGSDPNFYSLLGLAHAALGETDAALQLGSEAVELAASDAILEAEMRFQRAWIHMLSGNHVEAMSELELLLQRPSLVTRARLRADPTFRAIRGEEKFQALLNEPSS